MYRAENHISPSFFARFRFFSAFYIQSFALAASYIVVRTSFWVAFFVVAVHRARELKSTFAKAPVRSRFRLVPRLSSLIAFLFRFQARTTLCELSLSFQPSYPLSFRFARIHVLVYSRPRSSDHARVLGLVCQLARLSFSNVCFSSKVYRTSRTTAFALFLLFLFARAETSRRISGYIGTIGGDVPSSMSIFRSYGRRGGRA